jgi:ribosomal-protein-alanine N-acetyltransferase
LRASLAGGIFPHARTRRAATVILRTERLVLREFAPDDWAATHAYHRDPRYLRFYEREAVSERESQSFVAAFLLWQEERVRTKVQLAVTLAATGELIGNVGLRRAAAEEPVADTGYELAPAHWGRGYAGEAARAMLDWGFGVWGLERVHAHCVADNAASAAVLRRLGMREEARLRDHERFKGRFWDVLLFGILREEWPPSPAVA